jgi:hypothetical protein
MLASYLTETARIDTVASLGLAVTVLVNPAGNPKAALQTCDDNVPDVDVWLKTGRPEPGTYVFDR